MTEAVPSQDTILGIDIGSCSLSIVQLDSDGKIFNKFYGFHKENIRDTLLSAGRIFDLSRIRAGACTDSSICLNKNLVSVYNTQVAIIAASKHLCREAASVLHIGAEKSMLIRFSHDGSYQSTKTNTSCAAGTGSFLDQQAGRLNLTGIQELCDKALRNKDTIPSIASPCAVFANTDIIHAQQRGFSVGAICESLCKGLAENIINTVCSRETPDLPLLITGGVSKNPVVRGYMERHLRTTFLVNEDSHLFGAIGAGLSLLRENIFPKPFNIRFFEDIIAETRKEKEYFHEPLLLKLTSYPDFTNEESFRFKPEISKHPDEVEIDIYQKLMTNTILPLYIGIDIGSTSTKAVLIDVNKEPVAGFYTYTAGKPVSAVKSILEAIELVFDNKRIKPEIKGIGTTGSGRKFIGKIINADLIIDEITSHARAAYELNPLTDTIIEIGGQDAKFTLLHNGNVTFSQMNTVCAAGTVSFLHEQVKKLGCSLSDYSEKAENTGAPLASDRCAVFMERDISQLLNKGYSLSEILATALHSVTENYLKKVATESLIGKNICFQGATAKNKSLVAAFEQRLNKPIYVSKYCHLTGALGTALMLPEEGVKKTGFGDFYVCDNDIMNQSLNHAIEEAGGEVITTPHADYVKISLDNVIRRTVYRGEYLKAAEHRLISSCLKLLEDKYYRYFERFIGPQKIINPKRLEKHLAGFNISPYHSGESYENILKIFYILENYPDVSLFVQANPAFCCPSLVTEAMTGEIRKLTGVPVVTLTYDGTDDYKNDVIIPYLQGQKIT